MTPTIARRAGLRVSCRQLTSAAVVLWLIGCGHSTSNPETGGGLQGGAAGSADSVGDAGAPTAGTEAGGSTAQAGTTQGGVGQGGSGGATGGDLPGSSGSGGASPTEVDPTLAKLPLPKSCVPQHGSTTDLICSLELTCSGVAQTTRCYRAAGAWQCTCDAPKADRTYLIDGAEGLDACAVGAGLCAGTTSSAVFDFGACTVSRDEVGTKFVPGVGSRDTCNAEVQCQTPVAVAFAPGVKVTLPQSSLIECVAVSDPDPKSKMQRLDCAAGGSLGAQTYEVVAKGVAGACLPVLEYSASGGEPQFDGSKTCISAWTSNQRKNCRLAEACFDNAPLLGGVSAVRPTEERFATERARFCSIDDLGGLSCGCTFQDASGASISIGYELGKADTAVQCDLAECALDMRAEATGTGDCLATEFNLVADDHSCSDFFSCSQPATLAGRAVALWSQLNVRCERAPDQTYYCSCDAGEQTATFHAGQVATSKDACALSRSACLEHVALPLGPAPVPSTPPDPLEGL